jgi:hypothetical protein
MSRSEPEGMGVKVLWRAAPNHCSAARIHGMGWNKADDALPVGNADPTGFWEVLLCIIVVFVGVLHVSC